MAKLQQHASALFLVICFPLGGLAQTDFLGNLDSASICVDVDIADVSNFFRIMRSQGGLLSRSDSDYHCHISHSPSYKAFDTPAGLEAWTVETAEQYGYPSGYFYTTAGGSGYIRTLIRPNDLPNMVTPQNIAEVKSSAACGIKDTLNGSFPEVVAASCPSSPFDGANFASDDICGLFWVGGHTSNSPGLKPEHLGGFVDSNFWVSIRLQTWLGFFTHEGQQTYQLGSVIMGSKFARMPANVRPSPSDFRTLDHFYPNIDAWDLDDILNLHIHKIIENGGFSC